MAEPSHPPPGRRGARLLLLAAVVAGLGLVALSRAPEPIRSLLPDAMGALVARAGSAAAPEPSGAGVTTGRLTAAEAEALAVEAEDAWQRGNWAGVAESLTALAAAGPRSREQDDRLYEAEINLAWGLLATDRRQEAESHLAQALQIRPEGAEALEGLRIARQPPSSAQPAPALEPPASQAPAAPASASSVAVATDGVAYVVRPGDTLFALARRFEVTVEAIKAANGLPCSRILAGQKLLIPVCVQAQPVVCVPVCPTPTPVCVPLVCVPVVVCVPICPTPTPVCVPVVCVPVCPTPTPVCVPICPTPVCVPTVDP